MLVHATQRRRPTLTATQFGTSDSSSQAVPRNSLPCTVRVKKITVVNLSCSAVVHAACIRTGTSSISLLGASVFG